MDKISVLGEVAHYKAFDLGGPEPWWELKLSNASYHFVQSFHSAAAAGLPNGSAIGCPCVFTEVKWPNDGVGFHLITFDEIDWLLSNMPTTISRSRNIICNILPSRFPDLHRVLSTLPPGRRLVLHDVLFYFWGQTNGLHGLSEEEESEEDDHMLQPVWIQLSKDTVLRVACTSRAVLAP